MGLSYFENCIIKIKDKINKKVLAIIIFAVVGAFIIALLNTINIYKRQKQKTEDAYNKSLYDMIGYVNNASVELAKLKLISTNNLKQTTLAGIWRYSNLAKENLNILPLEQNNIKNTSKFLTQMSDFSFSLINKLSKGNDISKEEYQNLNVIYDNAKKLTDTMQEIYSALNDGRIKWNELEYVGNQKLSEENLNAENGLPLNTIGKDFESYEGLIYDGAFSEHVMQNEAKTLTGDILSMEECRKTIEEVFGDKQIENIEYAEDSNGIVDLYVFNVKFKDDDVIKTISITKKNRKLYQMVSDKPSNSEKLTIDEVKNIGLEFLKKNGIEDVVDTYYLKESNYAIINYAGKQGDIVLYPDLIKIKISLETGEVCSYEAKGYIFNHVERIEVIPKISLEEAESIIKDKEYIITRNLAIIPTDFNTEILTYEFKGKIDEREFLVYINAYTGLEEKVLLILDTPGGILTI